MRNSKYELKHWARWKRASQLLKETVEQTKDMRKGVHINTDGMPGGNHQSVISQMNKIIEECDKYNEIIYYYEFRINRLEKALTTLLNREQREVCIIYANFPFNSKKRESEALIKGYSIPTYYRILKGSCVILDSVLDPLKMEIVQDKLKISKVETKV